MSGEGTFLSRSELISDKHHADPRSEGWWTDNVWHPFVNGTGVTQIYNNFTEKKVEPAYVAPAKTLSTDWAVQSLASAGGAILTYTIAGKAAGFGLERLGSSMGLQGASARFLSNETTAQIVGAAAFDFAKAPNPGETRLGNTAGSIAAFGMFAAGNRMLSSSKVFAESSIATGLGRIGVGAVGGLTSLETSHFVSGLLGQKSEITMDDRLKAMANGGFVNFALPPIQKTATTVVDYAVNAQPWGKGIPVERYLEYSRDSLKNQLADLDPSAKGAGEKITSLKQQLAELGDPTLRALGRDNPLARVKTATDPSKADMARNTVLFNEAEGAGKLTHELKHLRIGKIAETSYQQIGKMLKTDPLQAEANYYMLRANMEAAARAAENAVRPGSTVDNPLSVGMEKASNGKTYFENWNNEFKQFQQNPKFRPNFEFSPAPDAPAPPSAAAAAAEKSALATPQAKEAPLKLGSTVTDKGVNFSVHSPDATKVEVLIYDKPGDKVPSKVIPMQKNGSNWSAFGEGLPEGTLYQYRAEGPHTPEKDGTRFNGNIGLIDPEARAVSSSELPTKNGGGQVPDNLGDMPKSIALKDTYNWQGDKAPNIPMADSVIYELNVRGYTGGDATMGHLSGTYRGLIEKIPHLKELGITAVELMPIMQGDRGPWVPKNPQTGEQLHDSWNYNQVSYKAPDGSLAADGHMGQQVAEFKDLVKAMHANNIEVILDVVYNHTREGDGAHGPTLNFRGLDNSGYYLLDPNNKAQYLDKTGCGNTFNANSPAGQELIMNSLRYWVDEMHVDGFRFDLAPTFKYDPDGSQSPKPAIMMRIENDPVLSKVKLIAEPWSIEQYYLGKFSDRLWSEWNGDYRDTVRKFIKSDANQTATLADRIAGSPEWFDASKGRHSINGITFHDGFTMNDLVTYSQKHNLANGEGNRDGSNDNFSWNSGYEGPVRDANIPEAQKASIEALRSRQVKNMMAMLMLSRGTPLVLAGDEFRATKDGNNNTWNQDKLNQINWALKQDNAEAFRFSKMMIDLRKAHQIGRLEPNAFQWHGVQPNQPDFSDYARFIAWQTKPPSPGVKPLYSAFNSYWEPITVTLPKGNWFRLVDTNLPGGQDIVKPADAAQMPQTYTIQPRSAIVLEGR